MYVIASSGGGERKGTATNIQCSQDRTSGQCSKAQKGKELLPVLAVNCVVRRLLLAVSHLELLTETYEVSLFGGAPRLASGFGEVAVLAQEVNLNF